MHARSKVFTSLALICALVLTSCTGNSSSAAYESLDDYYAQQLSWDTCYDFYECSYLDVPIDYENIATGTFEISLLRYPAQGGGKRLGSLIVNPGGPGASGVEYAYNAEYLFSPDITDVYDIVGFDPRGVSESEPIKCYTDKETDENYASDSKPDNAAELASTIKSTEEFIAKCEEKTDHLTSYSTANAARDMDILRAALGDSKLNYMGKSYGTFMGTLYAQLFPNNIGRVVLDGAVDPTISNFEQTATQAISFDNSLNAFVKECATRSDCPLPKDPKQAIQAIIDLYASAAKKPLPLKTPNGDKRLVTESLMVLGTASSLYDSGDGWPSLRLAIKEAQAGYGDTFLELADLYSGRQEDGTYPNNEFDSGAVIDCLDFAEPRTVDQITADAKRIAKQAPVFGPYIGYGGLTCKYFPETTPVVVTKTATSAPIIVIGTTRDPATPYAWSVALHKLLTNSQLVTLDGDGHTGQGRGSACIDDAIDAYYLKGTLPPADLRCTL